MAIAAAVEVVERQVGGIHRVCFFAPCDIERREALKQILAGEVSRVSGINGVVTAPQGDYVVVPCACPGNVLSNTIEPAAEAAAEPSAAIIAKLSFLFMRL
jgi:hypothetical protein